MNAQQNIAHAVDQIQAGALIIMWVVVGAIAIRIALRIFRARAPRTNVVPEPDTLPYRNARGIADWQRKKIERTRTGAEP